MEKKLTTDWHGDERRGDTPGRRKHPQSDQVCALHDTMWVHHDRDTDNHRDMVCSKISSVKAEIEKVERAISALVPWKAFAIVITIAVIVFGSGFTLVWKSIDKNQSEIKEGISVIHRRISENDKDYDSLRESVTELKWSVNAMSNRLTEVEKKLPK